MEKQSVHALVIDDNPADFRRLQESLAHVYQVDFVFDRAGTLEAGIRRLQGGSYDLVLLDLSLPDTEGLEAVARVRLSAPWVPVVVLSGLDDEGLAVRAVQAGAQDYLVKGDMDPRLLYRSVRYAMERAQTLEELVESRERYALAVEGANDGIWDWDLRTGVIYFSHRWKSMLGYADAEIGDDPEEWFGRVHPDDLGTLKSRLDAHRRGVTAHFEHEHRMRHRSGRYVWMLSRGIAIHGRKGGASRMAGSQTDITERKAVEERLRHEALHDELTGLPNRAFFQDLLYRAIGRARRHPEYRFAVLFLDLDRFKVINDSLGHPAGDELLTLVARRLLLCLRPQDTVARLGGDEFTILVDAIDDLGDAVRVASRIQEELRIPFRIGGHEVFTSVSIGISYDDGRYQSPEDLVRDADIAMYRARSGGRAGYEVFDREMHVEALNLLQLETDLRRALERGEFLLHYQPVVRLADRRIEGFEALLRWSHPERGLLHPADFVSLAEETGLILPIGRWVLDEICRRLAGWGERHPGRIGVRISVNLTGRQWNEPSLISYLEERLDRYSIPPGRLGLELTESVIMQNPENTGRTAARLRDLGVDLLIDDFGTGYSSLSQLHRFPITSLKIDGSFVSRIQGNGENLEVVRSILGLARGLGMEVIAEGVETEAQAERLLNLRCDKAQGFLFARPMEHRVAEALLAGATGPQGRSPEPHPPGRERPSPRPDASGMGCS
jgi:diguanylate cyclase (GGDEF)-like protein/PAS domain S-box-containing protein